MSEEQLETIARMSGPELQDLADRGIALPDDARRRLTAWDAQQAERCKIYRRQIDPETREPASPEFKCFAAMSLNSRQCPGCRRRKTARYSFCIECWRKLPLKLRDQLEHPIGQGYEPALAASLETLQRPEVIAS